MLKNNLFSLLLASVMLPAVSQAQSKPDGYKLVWSDEFNTPGAPNPKNWAFEKGFVRNNELQWYSQENAICKDGKLIIEARRDTTSNPNYEAGSKDWRKSRPTKGYTSASLKTSGLQSWQYGRFEMKARIDTAVGMWPAFWTLGVNGEWPSCGEIDIMEFYQEKILANIATGTLTRYKAKWFSNTKQISTFADKQWASKFHVWRMDWDEQQISLFVDDLLLTKVSLDELNNANGNPPNPFKQPHYILINLALGGDNGGDPAKTSFPRKYEIDYVRVYQKTQKN